jgi:hypothetical protein
MGAMKVQEDASWRKSYEGSPLDSSKVAGAALQCQLAHWVTHRYHSFRWTS